jgi:hypothetical protein
LVLNGDFNAVTLSSPYYSTNPTDVPNWTHSGSPGTALLWAVGYADNPSDPSNNSITTAGGVSNQFVTMGGGYQATSPQFASWEQALNGLTPGGTYQLTFQMASDSVAIGSQSITVDFPFGSSTSAQTFTAPATSSNYWKDWVTMTENFVATSSSVDLRFSANTTWDVGLTNVQVDPVYVPEPSTLLIFTVSVLPVVGSACRWRRQKRRIA